MPFYDVKGIRSDSTHSNYNGAPVTGVAKKEGQRLVCCVAQAQADVLLSRLHLCLPGWRAAEGRRRRAEQQFDWQEAARARGLAWDARGTDSSDFDEPQGAHRHH